MGLFRDLYNAATGRNIVEQTFQQLRTDIAALQAGAHMLDEKCLSNKSGYGLLEVLTADLVYYALMIADSDYVIDSAEVEAINAFMGTSITKADCESLARSMRYELAGMKNEVPLSFKILTDGPDRYEARKFAKDMITVYEDLGICIASIDGNVDSRELKNMQEYTAMLKRYADSL